MGSSRLPSLQEVVWHIGSMIVGRPLGVIENTTAAINGTDVQEEEEFERPGLTILVCFFWFLSCGACVWGWCVWLEYRPDYEKVRNLMFSSIAALTALELLLWYSEHLCWWMVWPIFFVNSWGHLDAVLRYPVVHGFDTFFALKHFLLIVLKVGCLILGFESALRSCLWMFVLIVTNLAAFPISYLFALPLDDTPAAQRLAAHDVIDADLYMRIARLVTNAEDRQQFVKTLKLGSSRSAMAVARKSPAAAKVIERVVPATIGGPVMREARRRGV